MIPDVFLLDHGDRALLRAVTPLGAEAMAGSGLSTYAGMDLFDLIELLDDWKARGVDVEIEIYRSH